MAFSTLAARFIAALLHAFYSPDAAASRGCGWTWTQEMALVPAPDQKGMMFWRSWVLRRSGAKTQVIPLTPRDGKTARPSIN